METDPNVALPEHLLVEVEDRVATLTLNRPESLNALSPAHLAQLGSTLYEVGQRDDVGVLVLTGAGRAFSAGGDLRTLTAKMVNEAGKHMLDALLAMRRCPKPVIAKINGDAVGGGNELVIGCDLAVASRTARIGQAGTRLGWAPIAGGTNFLTMAVGDKRSREITFLSKIVPAETACDWGWINDVVEPEDLDAEVAHWCSELLARSPGGLQLAKSSANFWWDLAYPSMAAALGQMSAGLTDATVSEGVSAFFDKRTPDWPERDAS